MKIASLLFIKERFKVYGCEFEGHLRLGLQSLKLKTCFKYLKNN